MMYKENIKKKDIIVILINLMVLFLVVYIYFIVENLKMIFFNGVPCVLKTSKSGSLFEGSNDEFVFSNENKQHVVIRKARSLSETTFQKSSLFSLAQTNIDFEQNGVLGPWILSNKSSSVNMPTPVKLTSRRTILEILDDGLYLIYIQVYYLSSTKRNSFAVTKLSSNINDTLAVCSCMGDLGAEMSCFTSIVDYFKVGESISVRLREKLSSGMLLSRKGTHTYLGLTKLS
ncbi:uncharacterized protein LOC126834815 isoform X1 [Adelges cooleyi]|uniref:uncharacterized protein LOC126834815 isoform X1 n=1 Tax=Adelges cooleyi TaxID=133065 RepID=UPI00217F5D88|nr:uncharacterized protein LOC126834815 isoform X1 [Adelges cooleyi]